MGLVKAISVIGCGESGSHWGGEGESIGVNDCWKFGHPTDYLMVINPPNSFSPERRKTILESTPHHFITDSRAFLTKYYPHAEQIKSNMAHKELFCSNGSQVMKYRFSKWKGKLEKWIQYSNTSPFAAISFAYVLGYNQITLWGVDFKTHRTWKSENQHMSEELDNYKALFQQLEAAGVNVYLGHQNSLLYGIIELYKKEKVTV